MKDLKNKKPRKQRETNPEDYAEDKVEILPDSKAGEGYSLFWEEGAAREEEQEKRIDSVEFWD